MNRQLFETAGVTEEEFLNWCKQNKKPSYKKEVKEEFFQKIHDGKLVKNSQNQLISKERK